MSIFQISDMIQSIPFDEVETKELNESEDDSDDDDDDEDMNVECKVACGNVRTGSESVRIHSIHFFYRYYINLFDV